MTHITREEAIELARARAAKLDWQRGYMLDDEADNRYHTLCNAAITHYIDQVKAGMPEADYIYKHEDVCGDEVGPPENFYTADTVAALLAKKDAYAQACQDEADSLRAEVERLKGASEPVAWQYRTRADWVEYWEPWTDCSKENHADYLRVPMLNDWHYETRALFAHPAPNVYKNGSTE
jgi:hypothetical protein